MNKNNLSTDSHEIDYYLIHARKLVFTELSFSVMGRNSLKQITNLIIYFEASQMDVVYSILAKLLISLIWIS